ncbi:MAG: hypothetical protein IJ713_07835 [Oscillibacter sp.]|nr:hypothetical protein [Oscillibacter sp.]
MKFIGKIVFHRNLNGHRDIKGTIKAVHGKYLDIHFEDDDKDFRRYLFPDSFVDISGREKYLWSKDFELNELIKNFYCKNCGVKIDKSAATIDQKRFCKACAAAWSKCNICGKHILRKDSVRLMGSQCICLECHKKTHFKCAGCDEWVDNNDLAVGEHFPDGKKFCVNCAEWELGFAICSECGKYFPESQLRYFDDDFHYTTYCEECYDRLAVSCKNCGQTISKRGGELCSTCLKKEKYLQQFGNATFLKGFVEEIDISGDSLRHLKTIPIMSRLNGTSRRETATDVLLLKNYARIPVCISKEPFVTICLEVDLVVIDANKNESGYMSPYGCTATALKQNKGHRISRYLIDSILNHPIIKVPLSTNSCFYLMDGGYELRAVTYGDQDYGKEWDGPGNYIEHNNYGDTSSFNIIGGIFSIDESDPSIDYSLKRLGIKRHDFKFWNFR